MTQRCMLRTAVAAALVATLALTAPAPAHAASRYTRTPASGWLEATLQWFAQLLPVGMPWDGIGPKGRPGTEHSNSRSGYGTGGATDSAKTDKGPGVDPDGVHAVTRPPGADTDPNG